MTDETMDEIYAMAAEARGGRITVHIYPGRMDAAGWQALQQVGSELQVAFWRDLKKGWDRFEAKRIPVNPVIDKKSGRYRLSEAPENGVGGVLANESPAED